MNTNARSPLFAAALALVLILSLVIPAGAYHQTSDHPFAHQTFEQTQRRTDQPVINGLGRTWVWGPKPYTEGMLEIYHQAPGGMRLVQYFDKSRMEINNPAGNQNSQWYVSNGLLVIDMIEGRYQVGDSAFDHSPAPSTQAVAGDQDGQSNITYDTIGIFGLRNEPALPVGSTITQTVDAGGNVVQDNAYAGYGVQTAHRVQVPGIDHTVASVFWDFMNSSGPVEVNGMMVTDKLFPNAFYGTGYPITEAYWTEVNVGGTPTEVLWQCFERRCLTYTPSNSPGWRVESGNVGQHYFTWRYGPGGPATDAIDLGMVALDDGGAQGPLFGCNDSLITVPDEIQLLGNTEHQVRAAVQRLLVRDPGADFNIFHDQNLIVEEVTIAGGTATIHFAGSLILAGVCDEPRVEEQLKATATQFVGVTNIEIMVNGQPWP